MHIIIRLEGAQGFLLHSHRPASLPHNSQTRNPAFAPRPLALTLSALCQQQKSQERSSCVSLHFQ